MKWRVQIKDFNEKALQKLNRIYWFLSDGAPIFFFSVTSLKCHVCDPSTPEHSCWAYPTSKPIHIKECPLDKKACQVFVVFRRANETSPFADVPGSVYRRCVESTEDPLCKLEGDIYKHCQQAGPNALNCARCCSSDGCNSFAVHWNAANTKMTELFIFVVPFIPMFIML